MNTSRLLGLLLLGVVCVSSASAAEPNPGRILTALNASDLDPALPGLPFEEWLLGVLPTGTKPVYEITDCGEQTGDPSIDTDRITPECVSVYANLVSRARKMELSFDKDTAIYRGGTVFSEALPWGPEKFASAGGPNAFAATREALLLAPLPRGPARTRFAKLCQVGRPLGRP